LNGSGRLLFLTEGEVYLDAAGMLRSAQGIISFWLDQEQMLRTLRGDGDPVRREPRHAVRAGVGREVDASQFARLLEVDDTRVDGCSRVRTGGLRRATSGDTLIRAALPPVTPRRAACRTRIDRSSASSGLAHHEHVSAATGTDGSTVVSSASNNHADLIAKAPRHPRRRPATAGL
jgi:hypothetical protein